MDNLREIETKACRDPKSVASDQLDRLARHYWETAGGESDFRSRQKALKRASFFAGLAFDAGIAEPDSLGLYKEIVGQAAAVHGFPQHERRKLACITARWLTVTGVDKRKVLSRVKGEVALHTATFSMGDVGFDPGEADRHSYDEAEMVKWMNDGRRLCFGTGADGVFEVEVRITDGAEPLLEDDEYARLSSSSPVVVFNAPTGRIGVGDWALMMEPWGKKVPKDCVYIEALPGNYKACAFGFSTGCDDSVIAVLCRTDSSPANNLQSVERLFA